MAVRKLSESPNESLDIRWMIRRDMPSVLAIENACFDLPWATPWSEEEFIRTRRQRSIVGMTANIVDEQTGDSEVVGFMLYELHRRSLDLLDLAVAPAHQRRGIGRAMINRLVDKLEAKRRETLNIAVSDHNTPAHLFLRACGGRAKGVYHDYFDGHESDMYDFVFRYRDDAATETNTDVRAAQVV